MRTSDDRPGVTGPAYSLRTDAGITRRGVLPRLKLDRIEVRPIDLKTEDGGASRGREGTPAGSTPPVHKIKSSGRHSRASLRSAIRMLEWNSLSRSIYPSRVEGDHVRAVGPGMVDRPSGTPSLRVALPRATIGGSSRLWSAARRRPLERQCLSSPYPLLSIPTVRRVTGPTWGNGRRPRA